MTSKKKNVRKNLTEEGVAKLKPPPTASLKITTTTSVRVWFCGSAAKGRKTWCALHYIKAVDKDGKRKLIAYHQGIWDCTRT